MKDKFKTDYGIMADIIEAKDYIRKGYYHTIRGNHINIISLAINDNMDEIHRNMDSIMTRLIDENSEYMNELIEKLKHVLDEYGVESVNADHSSIKYITSRNTYSENKSHIIINSIKYIGVDLNNDTYKLQRHIIEADALDEEWNDDIFYSYDREKCICTIYIYSSHNDDPYNDEYIQIDFTVK